MEIMKEEREMERDLLCPPGIGKIRKRKVKGKRKGEKRKELLFPTGLESPVIFCWWLHRDPRICTLL